MSLTADKSLYAQNEKARVALAVTAPDGSSVPSGDYSVTYTSSDANAAVQGSARGAMVTLAAGTTTLTASVTGLKAADRQEGATTGSTELKLSAGAPKTPIIAGGLYSLRLSEQGVLQAWGYNVYGQLGTGDTANKNVPTAVQMPSGVTFTSLSAGHLHSLALGSDGKTYAWGYNGNGQLGMGDTTQRITPTALP